MVKKVRRKKGIATMSNRHEPPDDPRQGLKRVFAQRLTAARMRKGWNQSELARQAALHTEDKNFGRALVSMYERARMFPNPFHLIALSRALGVEPNDLAPSSMPVLEDPAPHLATEDKGGGMCMIRLNQVVPWSVAMEILQIINKRAGGEDH